MYNTYKMNKTLIYSCVFFNENYLNLIDLLLKSYKLFGNAPDNVDYLIMCNPDYEKKVQTIFENLNISGKIWCLDLKTKFDACCSRLNIFNYPNINLYNKILYLDSDILITNSLNNILDFTLENKLYALLEGNTSHDYWGKNFFDKNPNCPAFSSGVLLFNNNAIIKDLFDQIITHINEELKKHNYEILFQQKKDVQPLPFFGDQPFIVYHAFKNNLYDNQKLIKIVIDNPNMFNNQTISHFPGGPGDYNSKIKKMSHFMNYIMLGNKTIHVGCSDHNNKEIILPSSLEINNLKINNIPVNEQEIGWNDTFSTKIINNKLVVSRIDSNSGWAQDLVLEYYHNPIPKIIMQTAKNNPERYIIDIINQKCPEWTYKHFTDSEIIQYFKENPIQELPDIIEKFNSFSKGQHKADLFRYYYLYLNGGIFLDSDAIFEVNIDDIIKSYDSVFVKSFMPNTHLFNGFIATYPNNPIIHDALKHAYETDDTILQKRFHYLCEELWRIYNRHNLPNMKIYQEYHKSDGVSITLDDNGEKIISHYWETKRVPKFNDKTIHVGCSDHNNKEIILPSSLEINNLKINNIPVNEQEIGWNDTFSTKIINNKLVVSRIDSNSGWAQDLVLEYYHNPIPKTILQLSKNEPEQYVVDMINYYSPQYKYIHFTDSQIIEYLKENPIKEFSNIINVFNSFTAGAHKTDLFRYFYLYLNGGVYLDYDAMIYTNIDNIILDYDCVFAKTFPTNQFGSDLITNAYLFVKPKDPVIYQALINLYNVNPDVLKRDYGWVCRDLLKIYNKIKPTNCRIVYEVDYFSPENFPYQCCKIFDENKTLLMVHYPVTKKIPKLKNWWSRTLNLL